MYTIICKESKTKKGYFGFVKEVPGAFSQGKTLSELKRNLKDAVNCIKKTEYTNRE